MANNIIRRTWKVGGMVNIEDLRGSAFQAEDGGHTFLISGVDENGDALALSGTPAGVLLRADGQDVTLTCSVSEGVVSATLPANAYVVPGRIGITIFLTNGGQKVAIYAAVGSVATTSSGTVAPPAGSDVVDLVNAIATAVATIPASYSALMADIAPTYSNSALYAVGQYAWYDGDLKRCIVPITTAESYTAAHWTSAVLGQDISDLKSAFNATTEVYKNIFDISPFEPLVPSKTSVTKTATSIRIVTDGAAQTGAGYLNVSLESGKAYTLSADVVVTTGRADMVLQTSNDGSTWSISANLFKATSSGHYTIAFTAPSATYYRWIIGNMQSGVNSNDITVSNIQLEKGTSETSYVPYKIAKDFKARDEISAISTEIETLEGRCDSLNTAVNARVKTDNYNHDMSIVRSQTKNLFNIHQAEATLPAKTTVTHNRDSIRIQTTGQNWTGAQWVYAAMEGGKVYTLSADITVTSGKACIYMYVSDDGTNWTGSLALFQTTESGHNSITITAPSNEYFRFALFSTYGSDYTNGDVTYANVQLEESYVETAYINFYSANDEVARNEISNLKKQNNEMMDVADGDLSNRINKYTTSVKSILESGDPEIDDTSKNQNVDKVKIASHKAVRKSKQITGKRLLAMNHDDLSKSDYLSVRKIYNKYGFTANFNFILLPFTSLTQQEQMIENVKAIIADGNDIGLHAIGQESAWFVNPLVDIRPDGSSTFAPTLSEITTLTNGKNIFGYSLNANSVASDTGFVNPPSSVASVKILSMTASEYKTLMTAYSLFADQKTYTGLDLNGTSHTWTIRKWCEYWYNELIDPSLGYSSTSSTISTHFSDDYEVPSGASAGDYYPDATHLKNGKIVFFDDTTNPHYSDSDYQKVGRFSRGLFKGCASTRNCEITDRLIEAAEAFAKHYFGLDHFVYYNRHGGQYLGNLFWYDSDYRIYADRDKTILASAYGKCYNTRLGEFISGLEHLKNHGITATGHFDFPSVMALFEGEIGLYFGQDGVRYPFFDYIDNYSGMVNYLATIDPSSSYSWGNISKEKFDEYYGDQDDWIKYTYENAGQNIGTAQSPMYVLKYLKNAIDAIKRCEGTGKIPFLSVDTVVNDASCMTAMEMLAQYCYDHNIRIVSPNQARKIASTNDRDRKKNLMPNPNFNQSLIDYFGGSSSSNDAAIPDGWGLYEGDSGTVCSVQTVDGVRQFSATITPGQFGYVATRIYGLCAGHYTLKFNGKKQSNSYDGRVQVYLKKNSDYVRRYYGSGSANFNPESTTDLTTTDTQYTVQFDIPEPKRNFASAEYENQVSFGYEDNVNAVVVVLYTKEKVTIHDISLELN